MGFAFLLEGQESIRDVVLFIPIYKRDEHGFYGGCILCIRPAHAQKKWSFESSSVAINCLLVSPWASSRLGTADDDLGRLLQNACWLLSRAGVECPMRTYLGIPERFHHADSNSASRLYQQHNTRAFPLHTTLCEKLQITMESTLAWIVALILLIEAKVILGENYIPQFGMCLETEIVSTNEAELILEREHTLSSATDNCACKFGIQVETEINLAVYEFDCDDSVMTCPWKLEIFSDGCLTEERCCTKNWQARKLKFNAENSTLHLRMAQLSEGDTEFTVKISVSLSDSVEFKCGIPESSADFCPEPTTTTEALTTGALLIAMDEITSSNQEPTTQAPKGNSKTLTIAVAATAAGVAVIFIVLAVVFSCRFRNSSGIKSDSGADEFRY
ncbi:hypothetical protein CAPTEDRAFT_198813 [Capitella teleta]|uniref:Uncharacterized protein n=1 Tax=Capitella teleta TaxID=283909 RepID=R7VFN6_CAPTE|nr:hypothetical protein CAPTEDRAFT_198813 [Capitella teleta]|eukprot:ELU17387.1 hypothetical protein CAPTEDRAFT_198813 [Capitella teleta]